MAKASSIQKNLKSVLLGDKKSGLIQYYIRMSVSLLCEMYTPHK